jgi:hypothetical protein
MHHMRFRRRPGLSATVTRGVVTTRGGVRAGLEMKIYNGTERRP